ncbi:MAG: nitronate monooxygenase [Bacteroidales bacterium]|jgi:enoyl-[acyl-carrier protein] reductase II|nr:nitronate monooxygenase [Bacteroidales bacterium]
MNKICELFGIEYPIIQGGMIWCSGWELAAAVSNAGGLGLIGAGSMHPEVLRLHIQKTKASTKHPFGVNIPLLYPQIEDHIQIIIEEKVPIVFTSAGNPNKYTSYLKKHGIKVAHVIANTKFALKCVEAGVDAIVAEGFEAGGHNGFEETTTMTLVPLIRKMVDLPLIAAGGIGCGKSMLAAMALGADGVQVGSRFVASAESSAHQAFKQKVIEAKEGDTELILKKIVPVRLLKNDFYQEMKTLENERAGISIIVEHLGKGRAKKGMFEGNMTEGELEIGQISANIDSVLTVDEIVKSMVKQYREQLKRMHQF